MEIEHPSIQWLLIEVSFQCKVVDIPEDLKYQNLQIS